MFKIRNKDGLFSNGGSQPQWTKKGKTWSERGHLSCHLAQIIHNIYTDDAVVVEFDMVEVGTETVAAYEVGRLERSRERDEREQQEQARRLRDHLERELARVNSELGTLN